MDQKPGVKLQPPSMFKERFASVNEQVSDHSTPSNTTRSDSLQQTYRGVLPATLKSAVIGKQPVIVPEPLIVYTQEVKRPAFPPVLEKDQTVVEIDTRTQIAPSPLPAAVLLPEERQPVGQKHTEERQPMGLRPTDEVSQYGSLQMGKPGIKRLVDLSMEGRDFLTEVVQRAKLERQSSGLLAMVEKAVQCEFAQEPVAIQVVAKPEESKLLSKKNPPQGSGEVAPVIRIPQKIVFQGSSTAAMPSFYKAEVAQPKPAGPLEGAPDVNVSDYKGKRVIEHVEETKGASLVMKPGPPQPFMKGKGTAYDARYEFRERSNQGTFVQPPQRTEETVRDYTWRDPRPQQESALPNKAVERLEPIVARQPAPSTSFGVGKFGMPAPLEPSRTAARAMEPQRTTAQADLSQKLNTIVCQHCKLPKDKDTVYTDVKCNKLCTICKDCMYSAGVQLQRRCPKCSRTLTDNEVDMITVYWLSTHKA